MNWLSRVWLSATPWTEARQAPLSMGFSRQEYWSGLPCPAPGDIPTPGIKPASPVAPTFQADSLPLNHSYDSIQLQLSQNKVIVYDDLALSVQFSHSVLSDSLQPHKLQHARPPCSSPTPGVTQTHVHQVRDAMQPSHPLSSPSPPAPNPSQHQRLFQWVNSSHEVAKVLEFQL